VRDVTKTTRLCGERDLDAEHVGGDQARCGFLRGRSGLHSWEFEKLKS